MAAGTEVPTKEMRVTILALHIIYHVGWNIHTVQASVGPDCLGILNFLSTQIFACFGDLVAKVAFCAVVTALRIQVCGGEEGVEPWREGREEKLNDYLCCTAH